MPGEGDERREGDEEVKKQMTEFYLKNPLPKRPQSLVKAKIQETVDSEWFRSKFLEGYREVMEARTPDLILELVTKAALKVSEDEDEFGENVLRLLQLATQFYLAFDEVDRERFPREVMRYMARSGRRDAWRR